MTRIRLPYNWSPRPYQLAAWQYLAGGGKHAELVWHRRSGKDELALHWTAVAAIQRPATYWHMLPEAAQARKAIWDAVNPHSGLRRIDEAFPQEIRETTREHEMLIKFVNGSTWQVIGSDNYNSLVGSPPAGVVFSEWALAKPEARAFLRPILAENGGWQLFVTTPRGPNHAKNSFDSAVLSPTAFAQKLPATETSVFTSDQLDIERKAYISDHGKDIGSALYEQEYMCSFDVVMTGRAVFDSDQLIVGAAGCKPPLKRVEIFPTGAMKDNPAGDLRVWKEPIPGMRYVIGADVSEGLPHGDFSSADVLDARTGEQMAQWHGKTAPDLFGDMLYYLGMRYNKALMGVERNNHGIATIIKLRDRKYPNIYVQADVEGMADDHPLKKLGWVTTQKSKFRIIDQLASELRDKDHGIRCKETIDEMRVYVIDEQGRYGAAEGLYDDRVMSRAIAGEMMRSDQARKVVSARSVSGGNAAGWT